MPETVALVTPTHAVLAEAFPPSLSSHVGEAWTALKGQIDPHYRLHRFDAVLPGRRVMIPTRIHFYAKADLSALSPTASLIAACLMSRCTDGHVRQASMRRVMTTPEEWALPFVIVAIGDYVAEVLNEIEAGLDSTDAAVLRDFIAANEPVMRLARARVPSYWDAHYRWTGRNRDYVGFRILRRIDAILKADPVPIS